MGIVMTEIYLLIANGSEQGEPYVLGWFDDRNKARKWPSRKNGRLIGPA